MLIIATPELKIHSNVIITHLHGVCAQTQWCPYLFRVCSTAGKAPPNTLAPPWQQRPTRGVPWRSRGVFTNSCPQGNRLHSARDVAAASPRASGPSLTRVRAACDASSESSEQAKSTNNESNVDSLLSADSATTRKRQVNNYSNYNIVLRSFVNSIARERC